MSLKINLTVPNKAVHVLIGLIVLTVIASGVYAYVVLPGTVPNPGHALDTIQGFFQGDASLLDSLGKVQQEVSGTCPGQVIVGINADGTVICEADDTGAGGIPSGMIAMFISACPSGWTRFAALDGLVPRGSSSYGATGNPTHTHSLTYTLIHPSTVTWLEPRSINTNPSSSGLSYRNVIWCKKD